MSIGPKDMIDRKLVQMYASVQTSNFDIESKVDPDKIMQNMNIYALGNKALILVNKNNNCRKFA